MNLCLCFVLICYPYSYGKQKIVKTKKRHRKNKGGFIMEYKFTTGDFEKEVLQSDKPVLVDFFCGLVRSLQDDGACSGAAG